MPSRGKLGRRVHLSKDSFRNALREWVQETVAQAKTRDAFDIQQRQVWVWSQEQRGQYHQEVETTIRWSGGFVSQARSGPEWGNLECESETWPALAKHIAEHFGSALTPGTLYSDLALITSRFLPQPVFNKAGHDIRVSFDLPNLERAFVRFAQFIESATMLYSHTAILLGLRMPVAVLPLQLSEDIVIDRLTPEQVQLFGDRGLIQAPWGAMGPYEYNDQPNLALHWDRTFNKLTRKDGGTKQLANAQAKAAAETEAVHEAILAALALTNFGVVSLGATATVQKSWPIGDISATFGIERSGFMPENRTLTLSASDGVTVRELFNSIKVRRSREDELGIAIRRVVFAMENKRDEDRLLDGMMAVEALMGEQTEMTFRISLRAAFYLCKNDPESRRVVFDDFTSAYAVRSKLVHGKRIKPTDNFKIAGSKVALPEFVRSIETYIRRIVRQLIVDGCVVPDWNDYIIGPKAQDA